MKSRTHRWGGTLGGTALALTVLAGTPAPAHANPDWTLYNEGAGALLTSTETVTATGSLVIAYTMGSARTLSCSFTTSNPLVLGVDGPVSAAPGTNVKLKVTPPNNLTCSSWGSSVPSTVTSPWTMTLTMPPAGGAPGQLHDAALTATLGLPSNAFTFDFANVLLGNPGCTVALPKSVKDLAGSYDAKAGVFNSVHQGFLSSATGCQVAVTNTFLSKAELTLSPAIDVQW